MPLPVLLIVAALLSLIAPPANAQESHASSQFFHRVVGNEVRGVLRIDVEPGFHIYHPDVGPGFALPTKVELSAPGVEFGTVAFPAPEVVVQAGLGPKRSDTFVWGHHGVFIATVTGTLIPGADAPTDIAVKLDGQVCDEGGCVVHEESYTSSGAGEGLAEIDAAFTNTDWAHNEPNWTWSLAETQKKVLAALAAKEPLEPILAAAFAPRAPPTAAVEAPSAPKAPGASPFQQQSNFGFGPKQHAYAEFFHRVDGNVVHGILRFEVDPGYHLYHPTVGPGIAKPTLVTLTAPGVTWNDVVFPEPEATSEGQFGSFVWAHHGTFTALVTGTLADGAEAPAADAVAVSITGQTCNDQGCVDYSDDFASEGEGQDDEAIEALFASTSWATVGANWPYDLKAREAAAYVELGLTPPATKGSDSEGGADVVTRAATGDGQAVEGSPVDGTAVPEVNAPAGPDDNGGLWGLLALAIGGGLFALVMPCTYPMIPITISYFTKQAEKRGGVVWPLALVYGAGIVSMFTAIGLVVYLLDIFADALGMQAGDAGSAIIAFAISGWFNIVIAIAFLYFALVLFGAINLEPPAWAMRFVGTAQGKGGLGGLFLMGFLLVITSFTCTGPFVGSILGAAAQQGGGRVVLGMAVFGLTMALPFVGLSLVPGKVSKLPRSGAWMNTVKITLGFVEVGAAFKFFSNADIYWKWGALPRELFFGIWAVIAVVTAVFLFGMIKVKGEKGEIGPARMAVGTAFAVLAAYFSYGAAGNQLGGAMTALAPPYSNRLVNQPKVDRMQQQIDSIYEALSGGAVSSAGGGVQLKETGPIIIEDDLDAAVAKAQRTGRALLVNFTGHI